LPPESRRRLLLFAALPAAAYAVVVSSQTGLNHHLRYLLPAYPFLFVLAASPFAAAARPGLWLRRGAAFSLGLAAAASLAVFPHSLAFFNCLAGGPAAGPRHLLGSNVDWGQDLLLLARWARQHPEARPLRVDFLGGFDSEA